MLYSKMTNGFYDPQINPTIPLDAVEISIDAHRELLEVQSTGKQITADADGYPIASDPPPPTKSELIAQYKLQAHQALERTDRVAIRCFKAGVAFPAAWISYTQALRTIVTAASVDPTLPLPIQPSYPEGT